jgi:hypothetical protein
LLGETSLGEMSLGETSLWERTLIRNQVTVNLHRELKMI